MIGVNDSRIRQLIRSKELKATKFGHVWMVTRLEVEKYIARRAEASK